MAPGCDQTVNMELTGIEMSHGMSRQCFPSYSLSLSLLVDLNFYVEEEVLEEVLVLF